MRNKDDGKEGDVDDDSSLIKQFERKEKRMTGEINIYKLDFVFIKLVSVTTVNVTIRKRGRHIVR